MSTIRVEVVDLGRTDPATGTNLPVAALRLYGAAALPDDPIFRIDPIDDALLFDEGGGWPAGPRRPLEVRYGDGHVDLLLGADVLESPLLEAGTPVVVEVLGTPATAELVWPDIAVRGVRPRRPVILTEKLREAERREQEAAARAAIEEIEAAKRLAVEEAEAKKREAAEIAARRQRQMDENLQRVANGDIDPGTTAVARRRRGNLVALEGGATPAGDHLRLVSPSQIALAPAPTPNLPVAAPVAKPVPAGVLSGGKAWLAFGAGLATAMALVAGLVAWRLLPFAASGEAQMTPDIALAAARSNGSLRSILATTGISPRGRPSAGVDAATALALADRHLHGADLPRDQGEASFWLRHALSLPLDPETMRWSLTQLGTLHAAPDGFEPDYAKARLLWEVASALGDPVAMCFDASLYEYGLGVSKHRQLAHALYQKALNAGGCPGLDEALVRTK